MNFGLGGRGYSMKNHFQKVHDLETLHELLEQSTKKPVVIFKHSTTCPISAGAYDQLADLEGEVALIEVQSAREISREIAATTGIVHQSPQVIVLRYRKPVWDASHWDITKEKVEQALIANH
jgi:bacillithiol system protein YtxJ